MTPPLHALIEHRTGDGPLLVLLHGRGSDERDLFPLGRMLSTTATVASPRAPFPGAPWGYGGGWAWYQFLGGTTPESVSFEAGQAALHQFITTLRHENGSALTRPLVLAGFSQGGTSALAWALRHPGDAAAVMVFSGFMADHPTVRATPTTVGTTNFWWGHGTADPAVPFAAAEQGWALLREAGASLEEKRYPGMGHTIGPETLADARDFLRRKVPGTE